MKDLMLMADISQPPQHCIALEAVGWRRWPTRNNHAFNERKESGKGKEGHGKGKQCIYIISWRNTRNMRQILFKQKKQLQVYIILNINNFKVHCKNLLEFCWAFKVLCGVCYNPVIFSKLTFSRRECLHLYCHVANFELQI